MTRRGLLLLAGAIGAPKPVIVDTDAGSDDLLAIAFLLSRPDVRIDAITVVNGLAHVERGADNLVRLLTLAGKPDIPVYCGRPAPMQGNREFPAAWRRTSDELPGVHLPAAKRKLMPRTASDFLREQHGSVLALGPLTNLADAGMRDGNVVIMGGALHRSGNVSGSNAEWNMFIDPHAASQVFRSGTKITLIPLDATAKVPIDMAFVRELHKRARTPLGRFAGEVLEMNRQSIEEGSYQAWDPLSAMALVEPGIVTTKMTAIDVRDDGRTVEATDRKPNVAVALDANAGEFKRQFLAVF